MPADVHEVNIDAPRSLAQARGPGELGPSDHASLRKRQGLQKRPLAIAERNDGRNSSDSGTLHGTTLRAMRFSKVVGALRAYYGECALPLSEDEGAEHRLISPPE